MKILHVNTSEHGGAAIASIRLHKALLAKNIESKILFLHRSDNSVPMSFRYSVKGFPGNGFISRILNRLINKIRKKYSKAKANEKKLENRVEGFEIFSFCQSDYDITSQEIYQEADIIHLHWVSGFVDFGFFKKNSKPVVWTLHDMNPYTGGCHYNSGCNKYKSDCSGCPQLMNTVSIENALSEQNYKKSFLHDARLTLLAPSEWMLQCCSASTLFRDFKCLHIPNSLDFSVFKILDRNFCRNVFNLPLDKKVFLFVSDDLSKKRKGFDLLLSALNIIDRRDIILCAIGENNLKSLTETDITFLGIISDERMMAIAYSAADAFILPSREDNLPNVMLESLACGTPVVSFITGGIPEIITTGVNGILADSITPEGLACSMNEIISGRYNFDSEAIRKKAESTFSPNLQSDECLSIYNNILSKS
jgi:glycosyltransferase involved in cell wall biosynthesis